uniref:Matrix metalloproteinase-17b n=1 Tax=Scatophagus argus TaxID=75038 RepID=A0A9E8IKI4_SCAAR|nr:matrix metalloproteinase-17b [Scatophagus argus]
MQRRRRRRRRKDWLIKYGYLPPSDPTTGQLQAWTAVTYAVRAMQRFAGLKDTGVVDEETMSLMKSPRCSLPDQEEPFKSVSNQEGTNMKRRRRRAIATWTRRNINWSEKDDGIPSLTAHSHINLPSSITIRPLLSVALCLQVGSPEAADLQVDFLHGYHGDSYPFDGAGGAVGHAFFPSDPARAGGVHLDAEEEWAFRQPASEGTDLFTVLVHEFGHALGLAHSSSRHSVMRPYYQGPAGDPLHYSLGVQDLEHITQLYGRLCFFITCRTMWRVNGGSLVSARGASVRMLWRALPPDLPRIDAVLERQSDHAIIFISGSQFWLFRDLSLQEGYPQPLSALRMGVNLASEEEEEEEQKKAARWGLLWDPKEGPVWGNMANPDEDSKQEDTWTQLLREGVSGITADSDGSVYLFKGDSYWKFTFPGSSLQDGYPRSSSKDWLGCTDSSSSSPLVDDLSLSPTAGRQELRERWREEAAGRMRDDSTHHRHYTDCRRC